MEKKKFLVEIDLLNSIAKYLSTRPYGEVAVLMGAMAELTPYEEPPLKRRKGSALSQTPYDDQPS